MKISTLGRHGREGIKNLGRNGWMTFAAISAVTVTLLLLGVFLLLAYNVQQFSKQIENQVEMNVIVKDNTNKNDVTELERQITQLPGVGSVQYVSKQQGLQDLKTKLKDDAELLSGLDSENPLPDKFVVKAKDPTQTQKIASEIETFPMVDKVKYAKDTVDKLFTVTKLVRNTGAVFVVALSFTALFLISNTIKITIFSRRREIEIMKLCGATNWFIRWPFLVEGFVIGIAGAVLPILVIGIGYDYLVKSIHGIMLFQFAPFDPLIYMVTWILVAIGGLIGMIGSVMSISRFLRI